MNALSTTFHEIFADNLALRPDKEALVDADRSVSYAALGAEVEAIAARLLALGVAPGARVIVHLRKSIAEAAAMFAVSRIGAVVVNVNVQWTPDQLAYVAGDCGAVAILTEGAAPVHSPGARTCRRSRCSTVRRRVAWLPWCRASTPNWR